MVLKFGVNQIDSKLNFCSHYSYNIEEILLEHNEAGQRQRYTTYLYTG